MAGKICAPVRAVPASRNETAPRNRRNTMLLKGQVTEANAAAGKPRRERRRRERQAARPFI